MVYYVSLWIKYETLKLLFFFLNVTSPDGIFIFHVWQQHRRVRTLLDIIVKKIIIFLFSAATQTER